MRRAALVAALTLLAAFATACGGHDRAGRGTILFQSDRSGDDAWYAVRSDGTGLRRIALGLPPDGADVFWNGDGTKALVVYDTGNGTATVAYVFDAAKGTRRRIRLPGVDTVSRTPWSPDGRRLVLATTAGDVVFDVETGDSVPLRDELADDLVTWSPDGKRLLFASGRKLYMAPADDGPPTAVMRVDHEPGDLRWSADGRWISFVDEGLYAIRANGTGLRRIDPSAESGAWSPRGEQLVFARPRGLVLVDLETGRRGRVTRDRLGDEPQELGWSPDGKRIVYLRPDRLRRAGRARSGLDRQH
jgi:Tol biopolymer transport system component